MKGIFLSLIIIFLFCSSKEQTKKMELTIYNKSDFVIDSVVIEEGVEEKIMRKNIKDSLKITLNFLDPKEEEGIYKCNLYYNNKNVSLVAADYWQHTFSKSTKEYTILNDTIKLFRNVKKRKSEY